MDPDSTRGKPRSPPRSRLVAALLALQLVIFELTLGSSSRFPSSPRHRFAIGALAAVVYVSAIASLTIWTNRSRNLQRVLIVAAVALTFRFYSPIIFSRLYPPERPGEILASTEAPRLVSFLRNLSAAEEQYRLVHLNYSDRVGDLRSWMPDSVPDSVQIRVHQDAGWAAHAADGNHSCTIWVRDSSLRFEGGSVEGSPKCDGKEIRTQLHSIKSVIVAGVRESAFRESDVAGDWPQHRFDSQRSGVTGFDSTAPAHRWTAFVGGPIRSSVAIAGNQVFIGAHTNGEIEGLSLDSGKVGFRVRAPNWIHHDPVMTGRLVIFAFGNNEQNDLDPGFLGSPPSGIVAFDRLTGRELWRQYTRGSVMSSPVIAGPLVIIVAASHEVIAYRARDGARLYTTKLPDFSPMANPTVADGLFLIGVEPTSLCAVRIASGQIAYCRVLAAGSWGAGHVSPAVAGELVLQVYEEDLDGSGGKPEPRVLTLLRRIVGFPQQRHHARPPGARREQVMVALNVRDGREVWRARLGEGTLSATGHTAGTPTISGNAAIVPSPVSSKVIAVDITTGKVLWAAPVNPARGSVVAIDGAVIAATRDTALVVLDAATGKVRCRQRLPQLADRAGLTISGSTGILSLTDGMIMARPVADWLACRA